MFGDGFFKKYFISITNGLQERTRVKIFLERQVKLDYYEDRNQIDVLDSILEYWIAKIT
jgi:hypothetical protein